jgi:hypothetical protein
MMEAWEQMLDYQLGEVDETWEKYLEEARPLQMRHELAGAPTDSQIDRLRVQYKHLLEQGRPDGKVVTIQQAATELSVSTATIYRCSRRACCPGNRPPRTRPGGSA